MNPTTTAVSALANATRLFSGDVAESNTQEVLDALPELAESSPWHQKMSFALAGVKPGSVEFSGVVSLKDCCHSQNGLERVQALWTRYAQLQGVELEGSEVSLREQVLQARLETFGELFTVLSKLSPEVLTDLDRRAILSLALRANTKDLAVWKVLHPHTSRPEFRLAYEAWEKGAEQYSSLGQNADPWISLEVYGELAEHWQSLKLRGVPVPAYLQGVPQAVQSKIEEHTSQLPEEMGNTLQAVWYRNLALARACVRIGNRHQALDKLEQVTQMVSELPSEVQGSLRVKLLGAYYQLGFKAEARELTATWRESLEESPFLQSSEQLQWAEVCRSYGDQAQCEAVFESAQNSLEALLASETPLAQQLNLFEHSIAMAQDLGLDAAAGELKAQLILGMESTDSPQVKLAVCMSLARYSEGEAFFDWMGEAKECLAALSLAEQQSLRPMLLGLYGEALEDPETLFRARLEIVALMQNWETSLNTIEDPIQALAASFEYSQTTSVLAAGDPLLGELLGSADLEAKCVSIISKMPEGLDKDKATLMAASLLMQNGTYLGANRLLLGIELSQLGQGATTQEKNNLLESLALLTQGLQYWNESADSMGRAYLREHTSERLVKIWGELENNYRFQISQHYDTATSLAAEFCQMQKIYFQGQKDHAAQDFVDWRAKVQQKNPELLAKFTPFTGHLQHQRQAKVDRVLNLLDIQAQVYASTQVKDDSVVGKTGDWLEHGLMGRNPSFDGQYLASSLSQAREYLSTLPVETLPATFEEALNLFEEQGEDGAFAAAYLRKFIDSQQLGELIVRAESLDSEIAIADAFYGLQQATKHDTDYLDGEGRLGAGLQYAAYLLSETATNPAQAQELARYGDRVPFMESGGRIHRMINLRTALTLVALWKAGTLAGMAGRLTSLGVQRTAVAPGLATQLGTDVLGAMEATEALGFHAGWGGYLAAEGAGIAANAAVFTGSSNMVLPGEHHFGSTFFDVGVMHVVMAPLRKWQGMGGILGRGFVAGAVLSAAAQARVSAGFGHQGEAPMNPEALANAVIIGLGLEAGGATAHGMIARAPKAYRSFQVWKAERAANRAAQDAVARAQADAAATNPTQPNLTPADQLANLVWEGGVRLARAVGDKISGNNNDSDGSSPAVEAQNDGLLILKGGELNPALGTKGSAGIVQMSWVKDILAVLGIKKSENKALKAADTNTDPTGTDLAKPSPSSLEDSPLINLDAERQTFGKVNGKTLILLTPEQFERVPDGVALYNIFGEPRITGRDYINLDIRGGLLAYGVFLEDFGLLRKAQAKAANQQAIAGTTEMSREDKLRADGFNEKYVAGIDEVDASIQLAEELRSKKVDPNSTHIPQFAELVDPHLDMVEKGIRGQTGSRDQAKRLKILNDFRQEAKARKADNAVTYRWWVNFNFRLSILATPKNKRTSERGSYPDEFIVDLYKTGDWMTHERLEKAYQRAPEKMFGRDDMGAHMDKFPEYIIIPSITGDLGISALNRSFMTGVHPFGLTTEMVWADGREMYPDHFFGHDHVHLSNSSLNKIRLACSENDIRQFHQAFMEEIATLPKEEREMAEFAYFLTTHELGLIAGELVSGDASGVTENLFGIRLDNMVDSAMDPTWYGNLLPDSVNANSKREVRAFLIDCGKVLNRIAAKINGAN